MSCPARIHALPPAVADAIAAGEVVERPASVVKELCENALDAGATRIEVDVEGGGLVRISVRDDGGGIEEADLPLAVARHATSKIATAADLVEVPTMGFRGEALASIAAVSELRLTSRSRDAATGATLRVRAGVTVSGGPAACAPGTVVEVADLFANTPARLRFLRSARSETAAVVRVASDLALVRADAAFTCRTDGRVAVRSPGGSLRDAARAVAGRSAAEGLIEIAGGDEIVVGGLICAPHQHRATRAGLILAVNGRRIHNRALVFAVEEAYRGLIPAGRHPFGVVTLALPAALVDVNVHPAKREVRFRDEGAVFTVVQRACWEVLRPVQAPSVTFGFEQGPALAMAEGPRRAPGGGWTPAPSAPAVSAAIALQLGPAPASPPIALRVIGQVGAEWIVAAAGGDVVLVDPHAAHEKILYARLMAEWTGSGSGGGPAQLLLVPAVVECDAVRMQRFEEHGALLRACGFEVEEFGPGLLRCASVPVGSSSSDVARMLTDALDALGGGGDESARERRHRLVATVACHAAVRFGDPLGPAEQQSLLDQLATTPGGTTCPHGRPTLLRLDRSTLRRAFGRPLE